MYKTLSWAAVILWMGLIFYLSHQPAAASSELSSGVTEIVLRIIEKVVPNEDLDVSSIHHLIRKNAHFFIYFFLGMLVLHALRTSKDTRYQTIGLALLFCVLYAISDEIHQLFIPGRGAQVKDVLIDSAGAGVGIVGYLVLSRLINPARRT
ncbi:VanZ family protein [Oceanobacillus polygoni]|uniref:VanZ family protein n=1 Tax=Oceanobacillus polygoni TaxID=1235259 RepID=A0A9X0YNI0_9BACI|nr:VanZ family protein [Oceanobacillus polygoni]MBP2075844.1 VanZ family protein [Oceanobacillus polygoni]